MTNKEAVISVIQVNGVPDNSLVKSLIDVGLDPNENYSLSITKEVDLAAISVLQGLLSSPDISEGEFSIKFDRNAIQRRLIFLANKYDIEGLSDKPTVTSKSVW